MKSIILIACLLILLIFSNLNALEAPPDTVERVGNMVKIPAGVFWMGSNSGEGYTNEQPYHPVYLDDFWIDIFEVTNAEYVDFLNSSLPTERDLYYNPLMRDEKVCGIYRNLNGSYSVVPGRERYPVTYVSWEAANAYAKWAGKRLPTEAEWEKAARGGQAGRPYSTRSYLSHSFANYDGRRSWDYWDYTSPVGVFEANEYGVYDMTGNIWEWTQDYYSPNFYQADTMHNPLNDPEGIHPFKYRIIRGGSWADTGDKDNNLRVSCRGPNYPVPEKWASRIGFRCASSTRPEERERLTGIDYQIEKLRQSDADKFASLSTDSLRKIVLAQNEIMDQSYRSGIKSMTLAVGFSALLPGAGQLYAERWYTGILFLGIESGLWISGLRNHRNARKINWEFREFADSHFDHRKYEAWLDEFKKNNNDRFPPNYRELQFEMEYQRVLVGYDYTTRPATPIYQTWPTGGRKIGPRFYLQIAEDAQYNPGWDDWNGEMTDNSYGHSENQIYFREIREYRKKQKTQYNKRAKFYFIAIAGNHILGGIDTIWGIKRNTIYRSSGWSWDMVNELQYENQIHRFNLRYRW